MMSEPELDDIERALLSAFPNLQAIVEGCVSDPTTDWIAVRPELLRLVRMVTGTRMKSAREEPFAAAQVTMMDREGGTMRAICYPVNRVELLNVFNDRMPERFRAFRVDDDGWMEEQ